MLVIATDLQLKIVIGARDLSPRHLRIMHYSIPSQVFAGNSGAWQYHQSTKTALKMFSLSNPGKIFPATVSLFIFIVLVAAISHFALPFALKNDYPDLSLKLNRNSPAFAIELNNYVAALVKNKSSVSSQVNSTPPSTGNAQANSIAQGPAARSKDFSKMIDRSRNILLSDPLNGEYYRLLGQLYAFANRNDLAYRLMMVASDISPGEIVAHDYIFRVNLQNNRPVIALLYGDRLFSIFNEIIGYYAPAFSLIIKDPNSREKLVQLLVRNPNWRVDFFSKIAPNLANKQVDETLALLTALNKTSAPVTNNELKNLILSMMAAGKYDLAHQTLISLLPPRDPDTITLLNNGGFDQVPTGLTFDWEFGEGKEARAQIDTIDRTGNRVLSIEFGNGRITFPNIRQVVILKPGKYLVEGKYQGEAIGKRGLFWTVSCYRGKSIADSEEIRGRFPDWRAFAFEIEIPQENCAAQVLSLRHGARSPSEQIIRGSISFDDVKITELIK